MPWPPLSSGAPGNFRAQPVWELWKVSENAGFGVFFKNRLAAGPAQTMGRVPCHGAHIFPRGGVFAQRRRLGGKQQNPRGRRMEKIQKFFSLFRKIRVGGLHGGPTKPAPKNCETLPKASSGARNFRRGVLSADPSGPHKTPKPTPKRLGFAPNDPRELL